MCFTATKIPHVQISLYQRHHKCPVGEIAITNQNMLVQNSEHTYHQEKMKTIIFH